jgi:flavin reductase (DIM6/NTAB) family NADH-FMN oxidoreductase RutF
MITINPNEIKQSEVQKWLTGGVAPRPIALVSTISNDGIPNLSPFSFFNAFGSNPPVVAFSPARRGKDNTVKDTYNNLVENGECVVHAVTMDIVQQINLSSAEVEPDINEFYLSGFTQVKSQFVKPFRAAESPFAMECRVLQIVELGGKNGSGNLVICEVLLFHINENIITNNSIDPSKIKLTARNGGNWYTLADSNSMFELPKPIFNNPIGYFAIPEFLRNSSLLSANDIAKLAHLNVLPDINQAELYFENLKNKTEKNQSEEMLVNLLNEIDDISDFDFCRLVKSALDTKELELAINLAVFAQKYIN